MASIERQRAIGGGDAVRIINRSGSSGPGADDSQCMTPGPASLRLKAEAHGVADGGGEAVVVGISAGQNLGDIEETRIRSDRGQTLESVRVVFGGQRQIRIEISQRLIVAVPARRGDGEHVSGANGL